MDYNIAIVLLGCIIVIISLILVFKNNSKEDEDFESQLIVGLGNQNNNYNPQDSINQEKMIKGINALNQEIVSIKDELSRLRQLPHRVEESIDPNHQWENFEHSLNYNLFMQKNKDIISLYQKGKSKEEIARSLNKSVREVEMVIKMIK
ncbi:DUF6115 domain-containing protein [Alkaliphilus transvaalensis]|uniref:DUF6115 domain-containing protein n=1 Tax=Alkaliphilus transvaalensis TaxID=114628 RepID=UPI00047A0CB3|nr:hypothetical protein [Alkaliphilus transvaalensis]